MIRIWCAFHGVPVHDDAAKWPPERQSRGQSRRPGIWGKAPL